MTGVASWLRWLGWLRGPVWFQSKILQAAGCLLRPYPACHLVALYLHIAQVWLEGRWLQVSSGIADAVLRAYCGRVGVQEGRSGGRIWLCCILRMGTCSHTSTRSKQ